MARLTMWFHGLNRLPRRVRWPIKWAILAAAGFLVCYPDPRVFLRHAARWRNPSALIQPDSPRLEPMVRQIRALQEMHHLSRGLHVYRSDVPAGGSVPPELVGPPPIPPSDFPLPTSTSAPSTDSPQAVLANVERYVYQRIPYAFDWETWGVSDYLPTLDEVLDMGREDCDGRAVLAASLLARMGYQAELVADFGHVWVKTDHGETMSPGKRTSVRATDHGVQVDWGWGLVAQLSGALAYGIAPFPLLRELIVLGVLWALLLGPHTTRRSAAVAALLLVNGLVLLRIGGQNYWQPLRGLQLFGLAQFLAGVGILWSAARRGCPTISEPGRPRPGPA